MVGNGAGFKKLPTMLGQCLVVLRSWNHARVEFKTIEATKRWFGVGRVGFAEFACVAMYQLGVPKNDATRRSHHQYRAAAIEEQLFHGRCRPVEREKIHLGDFFTMGFHVL